MDHLKDKIKAKLLAERKAKADGASEPFIHPGSPRHDDVPVGGEHELRDPFDGASTVAIQTGDAVGGADKRDPEQEEED